MRHNYFDKIYKFLKSNFWLLILGIVFLIIGISVGALGARITDFSQQKSLVMFMNKYFELLSKSKINTGDILINVIKRNFQPIFLIWLFSIISIGSPIILFIISFWGFVIGFTVAFLVEGMGAKGLIYVLISIFPQNLIYIPCLIAAGCLGIKFSLNIANKYFNKKGFYTKNNLTYHTVCYLAIFLIMSIGSVYEVYISPSITKAVSNYFLIR